jgi:hypothetical protein
MPVTGLGTSRAAALKLAVWRQDIVAVPGRSPSSHDPAPARAATEYSSNETPADLALLFSCSPLHEVLDVAAGRRFVLLSFLFGEDARRLE